MVDMSSLGCGDVPPKKSGRDLDFGNADSSRCDAFGVLDLNQRGPAFLACGQRREDLRDERRSQGRDHKYRVNQFVGREARKLIGLNRDVRDGTYRNRVIAQQFVEQLNIRAVVRHDADPLFRKIGNFRDF